MQTSVSFKSFKSKTFKNKGIRKSAQIEQNHLDQPSQLDNDTDTMRQTSERQNLKVKSSLTQMKDRYTRGRASQPELQHANQQNTTSYTTI
jgi:hypothetical protein